MMRRAGRDSVLALVLASASLGCSSDGSGEEAAPKPFETTLACTDSMDALRATAVSTGERGELLGCAEIDTLAVADVETRLADLPGVTVVSGVRRLFVAYRTERDKGEPGVGTALVYLPEHPRRGSLPAVVGAHGTTGLADACAPSHAVDHPYLDALNVSWAASGLPVIAPDYAGLGTVGVQGYNNFADTGRSVLDSARALRRLVGPDRLDETAVFSGHSQGGGAALAAAAYAGETPDVKIAGVVAFAPAWTYLSLVEGIHLASVSMNGLRAPVSTVLYADLANITDDESQVGAAFHPSVRDHIAKATGTLCYQELGPALDTPSAGYVPPATVVDFLDPTFRAEALDCADNGKCAGLSGSWVERTKANEPHVDPQIPILFLQGDLDTSVKPALASCYFGRLVKDGAAPVECVFSDADHSTILTNTTGFAIEWALATAAGKSAPACPATGSLPNCSPF